MGKKKHKNTTIDIIDLDKDPQPRTATERFAIMNDVELKLIEHRIDHEIATQVLKRIMNDYIVHGTRYLHKELSLKLRADIPRKYIINLYNDKRMKDQIYISADDAPTATITVTPTTATSAVTPPA